MSFTPDTPETVAARTLDTFTFGPVTVHLNGADAAEAQWVERDGATIVRANGGEVDGATATTMLDTVATDGTETLRAHLERALIVALQATGDLPAGS